MKQSQQRFCLHCGQGIEAQPGRRPNYHSECRLIVYRAEMEAERQAQARHNTEATSALYRSLKARVC